MNLLDTASLVVTPNGYKASKLYSIIPSDGTGDMTFARTGDTATRVNSSGLIETVLANKPRLDYLGGGCPKLLLEPQRTNLVTYSNEFDNVIYIKNTLTVSPNSVNSPDGTANADSLYETSSNGYHLVAQLKSLTISTPYTFSFFAKPNGRNFTRILFGADAFGLQYAYFNLLTDEIVKSANVTAKIETYSNGWKRCIATATSILSITDSVNFGPARNTTDAYNLFIGDSTLGIYAYGAQLEAGTYATSYIPTTTASVTRNADNCSKTSINSLIGGTSGTIFFNIKTNPTLTTATYKQFVYYLSATSQQEYFYVNQNNRIVTSSNWGSLVSSNTLVADTTYKIALGFSPSSHVLYVNGVQVASSTTGTPYDADKIDSLFSFQGGASEYGEFKLNSFAHWKTKLQNSELATLTSL